MYIDTQERFSNAQTLAVGTGDTVSTNVYDTGAAADVGIGEDIKLLVRIGTAVGTAAAGTLQLVLQCDDNVGFSSPKEYPLTAALAVAAFPANSVAYVGVLPIGLERYIRVVYRVATGALNAGTVDAFLVKDAQAYQFGAKNFAA